MFCAGKSSSSTTFAGGGEGERDETDLLLARLVTLDSGRGDPFTLDVSTVGLAELVGEMGVDVTDAPPPPPAPLFCRAGV